jgi:hypothetical protein
VRQEFFMNIQSAGAPFWTTSSFGDPADTSPMELADLGHHLDRCKQSRGRLFGLRRVAERTHGFVAARLVTTLVVMTSILALGVLIL